METSYTIMSHNLWNIFSLYIVMNSYFLTLPLKLENKCLLFSAWIRYFKTLNQGPVPGGTDKICRFACHPASVPIPALRSWIHVKAATFMWQPPRCRGGSRVPQHIASACTTNGSDVAARKSPARSEVAKCGSRAHGLRQRRCMPLQSHVRPAAKTLHSHTRCGGGGLGLPRRRVEVGLKLSILIKIYLNNFNQLLAIV